MTDNAKKPSPQGPVMDITQIMGCLPHRYPLLLVDRVIEITDMAIVGIKNVTVNEPFFQGHFPARPVMPGVLMVEAMAQLGGVFLLSKSENKGKLAYLLSVDNARFRKVVTPGDQLRLEVKVVRMKSKIGTVEGVAKVDGQVVCEAELMFSLVD